MNCNEIKNLISESENLAIFDQTPEAAAHIKRCASCRVALAYEEKLRQGFADIASEEPPSDLAAKIMAIQSEQLSAANAFSESDQPAWLDRLLRSFQGFPFKVAFAAGLTGFFAAVLFLRQPQIGPVNQPVVITQSKSAPAPADEEAVQMTMAKKVQPLAEIGKDKAITNDSLSDKERIPGAITFALDSSTDTFVTDRAADGVTLADQPAASGAEMQLAMAPVGESVITRSSPSSTTRFTAPPPVGVQRERLLTSQFISESRESKSEQLATQRIDPLADELRELIENNAIDQPEGFISLDELAMRGYLPAEQLRRLRPPTGSGWYLQKSSDQLRIFLKKR